MGTPPEAQRAGREIAGAQIALIAGLVLLLLALGYFFFLRGGGEEEPPAAAPPPASPSPTLSPSPPGPDRGRVETFELFAAKDPFKPLVSEGAAAGAAQPGETATAGGTTTEPGETTDADTGTTTDADTGTTTDGTATGGGGATAGAQEVQGRRVELVDIFTRNGKKRAQVRVDGTVYTVDPGETFADNFQLLSIRGACATFLFGDDQFTLCEGEEILK